MDGLQDVSFKHGDTCIDGTTLDCALNGTAHPADHVRGSLHCAATMHAPTGARSAQRTRCNPARLNQRLAATHRDRLQHAPCSPAQRPPAVWSN
jgi:hypothetical protein